MSLGPFIDDLRIDHVIWFGMLITPFFKRFKDFMKYWVPWLSLWIAYDMFRGKADNGNFINIEAIYNAELILFGWAFDGQIPSFWMRDHIKTDFLDAATDQIYSFHFAIPIYVGVMIFYVSKDKPTFRYYTLTFLITTYLGLLTFYLYPVAPPWWVARRGFAQPYGNNYYAPLINWSRYFGKNIYGSFYSTFDGNPFAAVPSLHSGYSITAASFFIYKYKEKSKLAYLALIYPAMIWFSAVYMIHHYIVDLIIGAIYVFIASRIAKFILIKRSVLLIGDEGNVQQVDEIDIQDTSK
ncbi:MAG: inositol phosphorylceramide synthase [Candidatus Heimdallarchaeota archaeon]|nr:inositol phosphorylceramide synthase [Candidatus Heimdallarchaeota archaeon]